MQRFRAVRTLQKFAAAHASIHNHFNKDRHLNRRDVFKQNRSAALAEWRQLLPAAQVATIAGGVPLPDQCPREFAAAVLTFVDALPR